MRYLLIVCVVVGTVGCMSPEESRDGRAPLPGETTADPMLESMIGGFDQRVWDYSVSEFLIRFPDLPDSCLQAPTVRWVEGYFGHPDEYFGENLDNLRNQAMQDLCNE